MKKQIEVEFKDGFVPPEEVGSMDGSSCKDCPFYIANDDFGATCGLLEWKECYHRTILKINEMICPIKKYFEETDSKED